MKENIEAKKEKIPGVESEESQEQLMELNRMLERNDSSWPEVRKLAGI